LGTIFCPDTALDIQRCGFRLHNGRIYRDVVVSYIRKIIYDEATSYFIMLFRSDVSVSYMTVECTFLYSCTIRTGIHIRVYL